MPKSDGKTLEEKASLTRPPAYEWLLPMGRKLFGVLRIGEKEYIVEKIIAAVFTLTQFDGAKKIGYTVILDVHCTCDGFRSTRKCKHMDVFHELKGKGEI